VTFSSPPPAPDLGATPPRWPGLDRLGTTQAFGGLAIGFIALFSSYDHITLVFIIASVATVVVDAECLVAQCRFLLLDTPRNRLQLSEAVALLMEQLRLG
jgi:hypothetical protein